MTMVVAANSGDMDAYDQNRDELLTMKPAYNKNQHYWRALKENYGRIKAMAVGGIIPINYAMARLVCKIGFR